MGLVASRIDLTLTLLELDAGGQPVNEYLQAPVTLYGMAALQRWLDELPARIAQAETELELAEEVTRANHA